MWWPTERSGYRLGILTTRGDGFGEIALLNDTLARDVWKRRGKEEGVGFKDVHGAARGMVSDRLAEQAAVGDASVEPA